MSLQPGSSSQTQTRSLKRRRDEPDGVDQDASYQPLPPQTLLLSLPYMLVVPPNHPMHICYLRVAVTALRKCLTIENLTPDEECQACLALVEIGLRVVGSFTSESRRGEDWTWSQGIEHEIEKASGKGLMLCEKHPSLLRIHKIHLTCLSARFAQWQHNFKTARSQLRHILSSIYPTDPTYIQYMPHLSLLSIATSAYPLDVPHALQITDTLTDLGSQNGDMAIQHLAAIVRLKVLVDSEDWDSLPSSLEQAGTLLRLRCLHGHTVQEPLEDSSTNPTFKTPFEACMAVHGLILGTVYFTQAGMAKEASAVLTVLHTFLDLGILERFSEGYVLVELSRGPPLVLEVTHPRILLQLAFLVSSVSKRDCVGRRPRRKVFAEEGLSVGESEAKRILKLPVWSSFRELEGIQTTLIKIRADLLCEIISVAIIRSEFSKAELLISEVIAFTRTHSLFLNYSARIALHYAHLAHALGQTKRARTCYSVAAHLAGDGTWIWAAASTGEVSLRIGTDEDGESIEIHDVLRRWCHDAKGTLQGIAKIIEACLSEEIVKSKQYLKASLDSATTAQDNHLRALILALTSSYYFHTAGEHASLMLQTCRQLAAGMGAPEKGSASVETEGHGNAPLGLWIGQRFLELYSRQGRFDKVAKQKEINLQFATMIKRMST